MLHLTPGVMIKGSVLNNLADIFQRNHDSREFWHKSNAVIEQCACSNFSCNGMRCTLLWLMPDSRSMGIEIKNGSGRALLVVTLDYKRDFWHMQGA